MKYLPNSDPERLSKIKKKYLMAYEPWTKHQEEYLIQLWKENKTIEELPVKLSRLLKLGYDPRKTSRSGDLGKSSRLEEREKEMESQ